MDYRGSSGYGRIGGVLGAVVTILTIVLLLLQICAQITDFSEPLQPANPAGSGFGGQTTIDQPESEQPRPHPTRIVQSSVGVTADLDEIALSLLSPTPGQTVANPVRFTWQPEAGVYYAVLIRDTEPGKEYDETFAWTQGGAVDFNLPNEAVGNLEWCIVATLAPDSEQFKASAWQHFTFDPMYQNKQRQGED